MFVNGLLSKKRANGECPPIELSWDTLVILTINLFSHVLTESFLDISGDVPSRGHFFVLFPGCESRQLGMLSGGNHG